MVDVRQVGEVVKSRPALQRRARVAPLVFALKVGGEATTIRIAETTVTAPGAAADAAFTLVIGAEAWAE